MRKFLTMFLCSTMLVSMVACGTTENEPSQQSLNVQNIQNVEEKEIINEVDEKLKVTSTPIPTNTPTPTPTPIPKNLAKVFVEDKYTSFLDILKETEVNEFEEMVYGSDFKVEVSVTDDFKQLAPLGQFQKVTLLAKLGADLKDLKYSTNLGLFLNDTDEVISFDLIGDKEKFYLGIPKYNDAYMSESFENMLGMSVEEYLDTMVTGLEDMPSEEVINDLILKYSDKFYNLVNEDKNFVESVMSFNNYAVKGTKYTVSINMKELDNILFELSEDLKDYESLNITYAPIETDYETMYIDYIVDEKGNFALIVRFDDLKSYISFIKCEKGICFFKEMFAEDGIVEEYESSALFYTLIESKTKDKEVGTLYVLNEYDEYSNIDYIIENNVYNFSYNDENGNFAKVSIKTLDGFLFTLNGSFDGLDINLEIISNDNKASFKLTLGLEGMELGTILISCEESKDNILDTPSNTLDSETWMNTFDMESFSLHIADLSTKYAELFELFMNSDTDENVDYEYECEYEYEYDYDYDYDYDYEDDGVFGCGG